MMKALLLAGMLALMSACAGYREINPASPELRTLKPQDRIWVYTGVVERTRTRFLGIKGDTLYTRDGNFHTDSVTRVLKEYRSDANTAVLGAGVCAIAIGVTIYGFMVLSGLMTIVSKN